jgi:hypothetical protein
METWRSRRGPNPPSGTFNWRDRERELDAQIVDDFNELVARASRGEECAVAVAGIALGPQLLGLARELQSDELDAQELVLDFLTVLANGRRRFRPSRAGPLIWMEEELREIARRQECETELSVECDLEDRDGIDLDGDDDPPTGRDYS